ncbi:MAG: family 10 glycosylhydrolase [Verrucomicrobiota bacterium]|jgi:uncharacterized lipoprotein YddW (UPF0748 family)
MLNRALPAILCSIAAAFPVRTAAAAKDPPPPPVEREFRGLWVATVNNIDWPSRRGLSARQQKEELIELLDQAAALHFNAIIFQVRPSCDALYDSRIEPWSEYLTGRMGQPPSPYYDPLEFAVAEAHKRALELHAWFNPYRVRLRDQATPAAPQHVNVRHPEWVRAYGKYLWLDPTEAGARDYSLSVILDVVRRYDIDAVHFDDYFYPYPEKADTNGHSQELDFPDGASWARYQAGGGKLSRGDWRRENVDQFVRAVAEGIKKEKPWVKFGISPFGIWRPGNPPQITGFDAYDRLFCDSRKWLEEGWLDYIAPQLYWPVEQKAQSFPVLLRWWAAQNPRRRHLWPGMKSNGWPGIQDDAREAVREIELTRAEPGASGEILWHARPLLRGQGAVAATLLKTVYSAPALVPAFSWLSTNAPPPPLLRVIAGREEMNLSWQSGDGQAWQWVLRARIDGHWTAEILPGVKTGETIKASPAAPLPEAVELSAVNRYGNESPPAIFRVEK